MPNSQKQLLIVFLGSIGSGKSYFARHLADRISTIRMSSDAMRLAMFGSVEEIDHHNGHGVEMNRRLWGAMNYAIRQILQNGQTVIYDAARFNKLDARQELRQLVDGTNATVVIVWVDTPREVANIRVQEREENEDQRRLNASDAERILNFHYQNFDPPLPSEHVVKISGLIPFDQQYKEFTRQLAVLSL